MIQFTALEPGRNEFKGVKEKLFIKVLEPFDLWHKIFHYEDMAVKIKHDPTTG
jgi:hypothetical protein